MKKPRKTYLRSHKRALKAARRRRLFQHQKYLWNRGLDLYDKKEECNKSD